MSQERQRYNLLIDPEFENLLPPLTKEEYKQLEENILKDGCQTAIYTWHGYIVDGHNRYSICKKHDLSFTVQILQADTRNDVMRWMIETQLGRRNLAPAQRITLFQKYEEKYRIQAKENQLSGLKQNQDNRSLQLEKTEKIHTDKEIAKIANVGTGTLARYNVVMKSDDEELKQMMLNDEIKISAAYDKLKNKQKEKEERCNTIPTPITENTNISKNEEAKVTDKKCHKCKQTKLISEFSGNNDFCNDCMKNIYKPTEARKQVNENSDELTKFLKTERQAKDYTTTSIELKAVFDGVINSVGYANRKIFEDELDISESMTEENIQYALKGNTP
jgi:hypothetical protein